MHRKYLPIVAEKSVATSHPVTGSTFHLLASTYGALSEDPSDPLSAVSVANSSLSIDLWKGCAWQCAYCHVQGTVRNLDDTGRMPKQVTRVSHFSVEEIVKALQSHPFFVANQTILSIGTSSTEPLAQGAVADSTFEVLNVLQQLGLTNPVWIVTKNHVPKRRIAEIREFCSQGRQLIFSATINGLDDRIEPLKGNRLRNWRKVAEAGAKIMLYLRPLVRSWGSNETKITEIMEAFATEMGNQRPIAIVPGGLRWTEGIDYGLHMRGLTWPEDLPKAYNEKDLDDNLWRHILSESRRLFPGVPVVHHSSCALSTALTRSNLAQVFMREPVACADSTCSERQRDSCAQAKQKLHDNETALRTTALSAIGLTPHLSTEEVDTSYTLRQSLLKAMADQVRVDYE